MDERERLQERYDDAAFALMMDECAEADGEAFLAEFRAAAGAGELPEIPEDLDRCFRDTIRREYAGRERKIRFKQFKRAAARVAVAVFAVIGILSTLVMSVEAFRIPVLNFFMEQHEKYTNLSSDLGMMEGDSKAVVHENSTNPMVGLLPEEYRLDTFDDSVEGHLLITYLGEEGKYVSYTIYPADNLSSYDTEEAIVEKVTVSGHNGLFVEKNGYRLIWFDETDNTAHSLSATHLSYIDFWALAEGLAG